MQNPLNYVSDRTRLAVYVTFSVIALVVGAIQVGYASIEAPQPDWLTIALAVVPFLAAGLGFTAATHTTRSTTPEH